MTVKRQTRVWYLGVALIATFGGIGAAGAAAAGQTVACVGDCNRDGTVTAAEVITMVNIALGNAPISECPPGDVNGDGAVAINEVLSAVDAALNGCPLAPSTISFGTAAGFPGEALNLTVSLISNGHRTVSIAALVFQFDSDALSLLNCTSTVAGKNADVQQPDPGRAVVSLSGGLGVLPDGIALICRVRIKDGTSVGAYPLHFVSAALLDDTFSNLTATGEDGSISVLASAQTATVTATSVATFTPSATQTSTLTATPTSTVTRTSKPTTSPTPTSPQTVTPTSSSAPTVILTRTPTPTFAVSALPTASTTHTATHTETPSATRSGTATATATRTQTFTTTATPTLTRTPTRSFTAMPSPTSTRTQTRTPTSSATATVTPTLTPTLTQTPAATATPTSRVVGFGPIGAGQPGGGTTIPFELAADASGVAQIDLRVCLSDSVFSLFGCDAGAGTVISSDPEVLPDTCPLGDVNGHVLAVTVTGANKNPIPSGQFLDCNFGIDSQATLGSYPVTLVADLRDVNGVTIGPQVEGSGAIQVGQDTPTPSPTPTSAFPGPPVVFLGVASFDGCVGCCARSCATTPTPTPAYDVAGRRIFVRSSGQFALVVEGKRGASNLPVGTVLMPAGSTKRPDLQIESTTNLGNGSLAVCDAANGGGVPAVNPPDFGATQFVTDALRDFACRFVAYFPNGACTKVDQSAAFRTVDPTATIQFCDFVNGNAAFPPGDSLVTVQLRDTAGNLGEPMQIVIRVMP